MSAFAQERQQDYANDGFLTPLRVVSLDEARAALEEVEAFAATRAPDGVLRGDDRFKPHLHLPRVNQLVRHPTVLRAVRACLGGPDVVLWSSDLNVKRPGDGGFFSDHQDATYTGLEPAAQGCTVWLALSDPVDAAHGCMVFKPGSHLRGQLPHVEEPAPDNLLSRGQRVAQLPPPRGPDVQAALRAGEASIHHFHLVHRSAPNRGSRTRTGLAMRFVAANVRQTGSCRECVTVFGDSRPHESFDVEPTLPPDPDDAEIAAGQRHHADAMRREKANYFRDSAASTAYT